MSKNKILIKITGSIAAYKVAYLVSQLVQAGYEIKIAATDSALKFIGKATLEGLTGNKVFTNTFDEGKMMSHINLVKWADIVAVIPATANTINKFAAGIGDNLVTSLFLAHDWRKPYLIAPAMNVNMLNHPVTQESLKKLSEIGAIVLPTENGRLACGDTGSGKLLEPDIIFGEIIHRLNKSKNSKKYLITSGGTLEDIDSVRFISNMSTGNTGKVIADELFLLGNDITLLKAESAKSPSFVTNIINYRSFNDLKKSLFSELKNEYDAVIHLAAVSDYKPVRLLIGNEKFPLPLKKKIKASPEEMKILFSKNEKLVDSIKSSSRNPKIKLISFKLLDSNSAEDFENEVSNLFNHSKSDFIVYNNVKERENNKQTNFRIYTIDGKQYYAASSIELSKTINKLINEVKE